jgi:hypothetical protein
MKNQNKTQPTAEQYLQALEVIKSANLETIKAVAKIASPEKVDDLANALAFLSAQVSSQFFAGAEQYKQRDLWEEALVSTMIAYSVEEYASAIEQAHEISGSFMNSADEPSQFGDINQGNFQTLVDDIVSNSH